MKKKTFRETWKEQLWEDLCDWSEIAAAEYPFREWCARNCPTLDLSPPNKVMYDSTDCRQGAINTATYILFIIEYGEPWPPAGYKITNGCHNCKYCAIDTGSDLCARSTCLCQFRPKPLYRV